MQWIRVSLTVTTLSLMALVGSASAQPDFVNGLVIPGNTLDATRQPGANAGRLGFFSDLYYDPIRDEWWALSDRGPGGGLLDYGTRLQQITLKVNQFTGEISDFKVKQTVRFRDSNGLLLPPFASVARIEALNGLNPLLLNNDVAILGRSFDPEGLVVDPRTGHFLVADEYGPSVYEFLRNGRLIAAFEPPANLIPKVSGQVDYVAGRMNTSTGRQDNRGFEGLAITPDGTKLYAVLQDPLVNEGPRTGPTDTTDNDGRDGRNVRIVVYDNTPGSATYRHSIAQYAYQLELQSDIAARITAAGGTATPTDPRQGRNIGLSAIVALNDHEFLVLERDNRGIGVDNPAGKTGPLGVVGSKRVYSIAITSETTDISAIDLPDDGDLDAANITPVEKSEMFIDLAADTLLPNGNQAEKWEGLTIGPRLRDGSHVIVAGNDNDYSVTQTGSGTQFDVYVDFLGNSVQRDIDQPTMLNGTEVGPVPPGYTLLPGLLHAYKASVADLAEYVPPGSE